MKPSSKSEPQSPPTSDEIDDQEDSSASTSESLLRRRFVTIRRKSPEPKNKPTEGPNKANYLLEVCKEGDRGALKRLTTDSSLTPQALNYKDNNGLTPLSYICQKGDSVLLRILCDFKNLDVNVEDNEGNTPLILATQAGHAYVVTFLVDRYKGEVDVNKRNNFGFTALMKAALQGRAKCLKALLAAGANLNLRDPNKGYSALEWAQFCGRKQCIEAIKSNQKSSKGSKRIAQAINETENWLKTKLGNGNGNGASNGKGIDQSKVSPVSLLATATATSALCASLPILQHISPSGDEDVNINVRQEKRALIVPLIKITDYP